jgi:hypothetical protein
MRRGFDEAQDWLGSSFLLASGRGVVNVQCVRNAFDIDWGEPSSDHGGVNDYCKPAFLQTRQASELELQRVVEVSDMVESCDNCAQH